MKKNTYKSKRFLVPILSLVLISIILITSVTSYISINIFKDHMQEEINTTKKEYTQEHKERVYRNVKFVSNSIKFNISKIEDKLKASLKEKIETALHIATFTYNTYKDSHNKEELKGKIANALSAIKFYNNRGYYFMYDNKTKIIFGHPMKKFIGKDMTSFKDAKGRNLMETDAKILEKNKIGFNKIYFTKPNDENKQFPKITCITIFEPLNIVLGIGEYLDVIENQTKKHVLERFSQENFNNGDKYLVILDLHNIDGGDEFATVLLNPNKQDIIGKKVSDKVVDIKGNRFRKDFLDLIKEKGEGFIQYWYKKPSTNEPALKVSYIYLQKDWNWIILSGFYYEDLEKQISIMKKSITTHTNNTINKTLIWVSILCLISIFTAIYLSFKIDNTIKEYTNKIIEHEDNKRKQQNLLIQQSKMAAMGEMLANIAHQWRQPLSAISTAATGVKLQKEINCLTDKDFDSALTSINSSAQYLSHTIDDFRNFFNPNNSKIEEFNISKTFNKILSILSAQFTAKEIEIIKNIDNIELNSIENELMQVLMNILNNSRDVLGKFEDQKRLIFIDSYKNQNNLLIEIKDNGKGVSEEIIDRIFEPYFTTKHKSQGTGIGLYMSKSIIEKHLNGTITVTNTTYTYENIKYKGAKFTIEIPIEKV